MSYSQYSRKEEDNSQSSGSFNLCHLLGSTTKHTRRMGTVRNSRLPQRLKMTDGNTPVNPGSHHQSTPHWNSSSSSHRPMPIPMPDLNPFPTPTQERPKAISRPIPEEEPEDHVPEHGRRSLSQPAPVSPALREQNRYQNRRLERSPSPPSLRSAGSHYGSLSSLQTGGTAALPSFGRDRGDNHSGSRNVDSGVIMVQGHAYAVLKIIGKGGSSVVYEVFDEKRNLRAIKKVDLSEADTAQAQGYLNEINMLEKLQGHHRIIRMFGYEFRREEDLLFVVMERGDTDLATLLKSINAHNTITPVQRMFYWSEMLEAVQVIHNAGIIHSDLKPANFLVVGGTLKLIDFGIASAVQSDKTSIVKDTQMGTFNFMSPEAIEDLSTEEDRAATSDHRPRIKISLKSDIWSLGCILYNLTYGKMPFAEFRMPIKKLEAIINPNYQIPYPDQGHEPLLVDTIQRCLVRNPHQRASVEELLNHPYLKSNAAENVPPKSDKLTSVEQLLSQLGHVLSPNMKDLIREKVQKKGMQI